MTPETIRLLDMLRSHRWTSDYKKGVEILEALLARERRRLRIKPTP